MPSFIAHSATANVLIKTILCLIEGVEGGAEGGIKGGAECGVKKVVADRVEGRARARCCEVLRWPSPLLIR
jgi:hypothetical protein